MDEETRSPLDNSITAFLASVVVLTVIGVALFEFWTYLFSIAVAWVLSDFILNLIIRGGSGIAQIPFYGTAIQTKGRSYLAFLIGIFVGTWISTIFSDVIFRITGFAVIMTTGTTLPISQSNMLAVFASSAVVGLLVFVDLNARFYERS